MGSQRIVITFLLALFVLASVQADFDVTFEPIRDEILPGDAAYYTITVENNLDVEDRIRINLDDIDWILRSEPDQYFFTGIPLEAGEEESFDIVLRPSRVDEVNKYLLNLRFNSEATGETKYVQLQVSITNPDGTVGQYLVAVNRLVEYDQRIDPRDGFTARVNMKNRNPRDIDNFSVTIESDLFIVTNSTPLEPLGEQILTLHAPLDPQLTPQDVDMVVSFRADGELLRDRFYEGFEVISYTSINRTEDHSRGIFRSVTSYSYENIGNAPATVVDSRRSSWLGRVFTSLRINDERVPKTILTNESGSYIQWTRQLDTDESLEVSLTTNYSLLVWIAIIAALAIVVYYLMKSPITVRKDAVVVGVSEGGISEIRVVIHLKNLSARTFSAISVIDSIPKIAEYLPESDEQHDTLRVYTNEREGSVVKWNLETLERYEERILTYRIRSKLSIVGGITLPRTLIRFTDDQGQEQVSRGNAERVSL